MSTFDFGGRVNIQKLAEEKTVEKLLKRIRGSDLFAVMVTTLRIHAN